MVADIYIARVSLSLGWESQPLAPKYACDSNIGLYASNIYECQKYVIITIMVDEWEAVWISSRSPDTTTSTHLYHDMLSAVLQR